MVVPRSLTKNLFKLGKGRREGEGRVVSQDESRVSRAFHSVLSAAVDLILTHPDVRGILVTRCTSLQLEQRARTIIRCTISTTILNIAPECPSFAHVCALLRSICRLNLFMYFVLTELRTSHHVVAYRLSIKTKSLLSSKRLASPRFLPPRVLRSRKQLALLGSNNLPLIVTYDCCFV